MNPWGRARRPASARRRPDGRHPAIPPNAPVPPLPRRALLAGLAAAALPSLAGTAARAATARRAWGPARRDGPPSDGLAGGNNPFNGPWTLGPDAQATLGEALALAGVPGASLAVVEGGKTAQALGLGVRDTRSGLPMTPDTVTAAASLGKPVFAYAVLRLVQAGRLDLDRPLAEAAPLPDLGDARARLVTARHVLSHGTGFPNWRSRAEPLVPAFAPGERFGYSGEGYYLLQRVVEHVTGQPVERVLQEQVFGPLGMGRTGALWRPALGDAVAAGFERRGAFGYSPREDAERLAAAEARVGRPAPEWTAGDALRALALLRPGEPAVPNGALPNVAGSLVTTAADYARFLAGALAPRGPHALDARLRAEMLTPRTRLNDRLGWGLGWGLERARDAAYAWHWGDNGVFKNFVLHDPERGRGVVVFTNSALGAKVYDRAVRAAARRDSAGLLYWMVG